MFWLHVCCAAHAGPAHASGSVCMELSSRAARGLSSLSGQHWQRAHFQTTEPALVASGSVCNSSVMHDMMGAQELPKRAVGARVGASRISQGYKHPPAQVNSRGHLPGRAGKGLQCTALPK